MELYFMNRDFSPAGGPAEGFTSVVWSERYFEPGTFTLHFPRTLLPEIGEAAYVRSAPLSDGSILCGRIEFLRTGEDGDCELGGRMLESLLCDRVLAGRSSVTGGLTEGILSAVSANLRNLGVRIGEEQAELPESVTLCWEWDNLSDWLYAALRPFGASYRITLDPETLRPVFRIVRGTDRSSDSDGTVQRAVFSASFGNLMSLTLERESGALRTFAYVEGRDGTVVSVDGTGGDASLRRELHRKAADIDPDDFASDGAYRAALARRGEELLAGYPEGLSVSAECEPDALPRYGVDYALGDVCDVADDGLGISFALRLTAADRVWEDGRETLYPSFGEEVRGVKRLLAKLKG